MPMLNFYFMLQIVNKYEPDFIALHCQEIGGKCYANSKEDVIKFVK